VPAVVVLTKTSLVFVLDRQTGEPLFPVEERPVQDFPLGDRLISRVGDHHEWVTGGAVGDDS